MRREPAIDRCKRVLFSIGQRRRIYQSPVSNFVLSASSLLLARRRVVFETAFLGISRVLEVSFLLLPLYLLSSSSGLFLLAQQQTHLLIVLSGWMPFSGGGSSSVIEAVWSVR